MSCASDPATLPSVAPIATTNSRESSPSRDLSSVSAAGRAIRQRIRNRVRSFVRRNVSAPSHLELERLRRSKEFEVEVAKWLPEFLQEALRNLAPYANDQRRVIKKVAHRRGLLAAPGTFAALLREWPDENLHQALREFHDSYSLAQRHALEREIRWRGLSPPGC